MKLGYLLSLDEEAWGGPGPRFRTVEAPRLPYLSRATPVDLQPVRGELGGEPPSIGLASPAMGVFEHLALGLMVLVSIAFSAYLAFGAAHAAKVRKDTMLARDLRQTEMELNAAHRACRALQAELAARRSSEGQPGEIHLVVAPSVLLTAAHR